MTVVWDNIRPVAKTVQDRALADWLKFRTPLPVASRRAGE